MSEHLPIILTRHAVERARERLRLTEPQLQRLMRTIHQRGARREFMGKELMQYFDRSLRGQSDALRESVIHQGHLFVIERAILVTVRPVPVGLHRYALEAAKENRKYAQI